MAKIDEVKIQLKERLRSQYQPGDQFPTEAELVRQLGFGRSTIREAIGQLVSEGYLTRTQGKGTFVACENPPHATIAVVVPTLYAELDRSHAESVVVPLLASVTSEARKHGAKILLYVNDESLEAERDDLLDLINRRVDGAIVFYIGGDKNKQCLEMIQDAGIPLVLVDRYVEGLDTDYVITDNAACTRDAVNAIADMGIENIYYVTHIDDSSTVRDRMMGYVRAVDTLGISSNVIILADFTKDRAIDAEIREYMSVRKSLESISLPAAILSANADIHTIVSSLLEDIGAPLDQLVLGHVDKASHLLSNVCNLQIDQAHSEMGAKCVQILMNRLSGSDESCKLVLNPLLTFQNTAAFVGTKKAADASSVINH
ncbi:MAG: GntR family transcriptional regulator [Armatimonadota bacterium]|nr:GntR family transcriptional regulator [bacterium]